jgi:hypothetical protein
MSRASQQELAGVAAALRAAVCGQDAAAAAVIGALQLSRLGLQPQQQATAAASGAAARPSLSLLLTGPSGVGKSTMARALAESLMPGETQVGCPASGSSIRIHTWTALFVVYSILLVCNWVYHLVLLCYVMCYVMCYAAGCDVFLLWGTE